MFRKQQRGFDVSARRLLWVSLVVLLAVVKSAVATTAAAADLDQPVGITIDLPPPAE